MKYISLFNKKLHNVADYNKSVRDVDYIICRYCCYISQYNIYTSQLELISQEYHLSYVKNQLINTMYIDKKLIDYLQKYKRYINTTVINIINLSLEKNLCLVYKQNENIYHLAKINNDKKLIIYNSHFQNDIFFFMASEEDEMNLNEEMKKYCLELINSIEAKKLLYAL